MTITVNGTPQPLPGNGLLSEVVAQTCADSTGTAVAHNGVVVPRGALATTPVTAGDVIEIVTAVQGG
ncbi:sulfur carrier protein ThiS [Nocardioides dubius]|uniref:Sulfur carrier protein ThiS n=1 Tax=Nocardioides dubius TaxID=317019 RepID=A0ABP4ENC8_9ACTN